MTVFADLPRVTFSGQATTSDLAYRWYDKDRIVRGKRLEDWLRPAVCYWHSFSWPGSDVFGIGALPRPWLGDRITPAMSDRRMDAAFDFFSALDTPFFCFHDVDAMASVSTLAEHRSELARTEAEIAARMQRTGVKLLWGTANLFGHPRYAAGAATNPDPEVFAYGATQVRLMLETTHRLGGENYVLWGGREGYDSLLNTDMKREMDQLGRFMEMVVDHKHKIGFKGAILIEPKPFEPTKHQYDRDVAAVVAFLERYGLRDEIKVNIEVNHATLAGLDFEHEVAAAMAYGVFGSIDMNRGDPRNGWDTDQFPNNAQDLTPAMHLLMREGGFSTGGFNFDAKVRRQSIDPLDLLHAHVGGLDTLARALLNAAAIIEDGQLDQLRDERYANWHGDLGQRILDKTTSLEAISEIALRQALDPKPRSGRQERLENLLNRFV
jgi:xylose isomerase